MGRGVLRDAITAGTRFALLSQPGPRRAIGEWLACGAEVVVDVASLDEDALHRLLTSVPEVDLVVGAGGGVAMDAAKYVAWQRALPLILTPTIVSVDACVTNTIAVRRGGRVTYEGFVVAEAIIVDFDVIRVAPREFNRAGLGDVLSAHTALWDWRLAADRGHVSWQPGVAASAARILDRVEAQADEIFAVSDRGIELLIQSYAEMNDLCLQVGHSQPEEGSEHYFAYLAEKVAGHPFIHGEVVGLGAVVMAAAQGNDPERPAKILARCGVEWRASHLGLSAPQTAQILHALPAFVREAGLPYSIIDEIEDGTESLRSLVALSEA